jgi:hypothetical protein
LYAYSVHPAELAKTVQQSLTLLASDLCEVLGPKLAHAFDRADWWEGVNAKNGPFARRDIASWKDLLGGSFGVDRATSTGYQSGCQAVFERKAKCL